jgi:hypothetical protein
MFAEQLLEGAGASGGSFSVPVLILGWFVVMTLVGWQVSRQSGTARSKDSQNPPSQFDNR